MKRIAASVLISEDCATPAELTAKLKSLFAEAFEKMLESEMDEHLDYKKNSSTGNGSNGYGKNFQKRMGESKISVPRGHNTHP